MNNQPEQEEPRQIGGPKGLNDLLMDLGMEEEAARLSSRPKEMPGFSRGVPRKLKELSRRYGLAPAPNGDIDWMGLALALAFEHEPGFRRPSKRGARKLGKRDVMLILDVERLQTEKAGRSDSEAISILVRVPRFAKRWGGKNERTLENALVKARKDQRTLDMIARLRESAHKDGRPDFWEWLDRCYQQPLGRASRKLKSQFP